ncbi:tagaturonate reductase [Paenibacillus pectinilyticus]|nr:tagaturonate reductase [Paenibacillus pectinilyticus]
MAERLNANLLCGEQKRGFDDVVASPVTVLQIGEGNFLRGFADWMLHVSREQGMFHGSVAVTQPRATGKAKIEELAAQDGIYTLVIRGLENGMPVERQSVVSIISQVIDPYEDWNRFIALAESDCLRFVISNTTEAGITYKQEQLTDSPIASFPGKMAYLLYRRYLSFGGAADKGLIFLPCELLENNGQTLRDIVIQYSLDWGFPEDFRAWLTRDNRFLNTLVDRIVTGYPEEEQAQAWFSEWSYTDRLLTTAEPYHLWAIQGEESLDEQLPLQKAGLNVHWTNDLRPYQQRKVRILNAAHTWMAPIGILHGIEHVREMMEHQVLGQAVKTMVRFEIIPTLPYSVEEMNAYADTVFERFSNPFIHHRLTDIGMNSLSKFKVRLLPSLSHYADLGLQIPEELVAGMAGLLRYYDIAQVNGQFEGRDFQGGTYVVRDDTESLMRIAEIWTNAKRNREDLQITIKELLALKTVWGINLEEWNGFADSIWNWWIKVEGGDEG